jgi:hypothetical protein
MGNHGDVTMIYESLTEATVRQARLKIKTMFKL